MKNIHLSALLAIIFSTAPSIASDSPVPLLPSLPKSQFTQMEEQTIESTKEGTIQTTLALEDTDASSFKETELLTPLPQSLPKSRFTYAGCYTVEQHMIDSAKEKTAKTALELSDAAANFLNKAANVKYIVDPLNTDSAILATPYPAYEEACKMVDEIALLTDKIEADLQKMKLLSRELSLKVKNLA